MSGQSLGLGKGALEGDYGEEAGSSWVLRSEGIRL